MTKRELVEYMDNRVRNCWKILDAIPEDKWDWRPVEHMMALGELANHLITLLDIESEIFSGNLTPESYEEKVKARTVADKTSLIAASREYHTRAMKFYQGMTEDDFETGTFTTPFGTTMSYKGGVLAQLEHFAHHRTQLWCYLNILGEEVDRCDLWK